MVPTARVQARRGITDAVRRDGIDAASLHGAVPVSIAQQDGDRVSGDRVLTHVPIPGDAVVATGTSLRGKLFVVGVHWRSRGWVYAASRVVLTDGSGDVLLASPWRDGAWDGDSVLRGDFDPDLPPATNTA